MKNKDLYLQEHGVRCLYCRSVNIQADAPQSDSHDAGIIIQDVTCNNCGKMWTELMF